MITLQTRQDLETYILNKLNDVFSQFPDTITSTTTFHELNRKTDIDSIDIAFVADIEDDLGVDISEQKAEQMDAGDVAGFIDYFSQQLNIN